MEEDIALNLVGDLPGSYMVGLYQLLNPQQLGKTPTTTGWFGQAALECETTYSPWQVKSPDDLGCIEENCAVATGNVHAGWLDVQCSSNFICKCQWPGTTAPAFVDYMTREGLLRSG